MNTQYGFSNTLLLSKDTIVRIVFVLLSIAVVSSCATSIPQLPITDPDERIQFNGFSLLPPKGHGWNWVGRKEQDKSEFFNAMFTKNDGDRTYVAKVRLFDTEEKEFHNPEELLSFVKSAKNMNEAPRQRNIRSTFKIDYSLGSPCVRFDFEADDPLVPGKPNIVFAIDAHGLFCAHPTASNVMMMIDYSRRSPKGQPYVAGTDEGEHFLMSVQFTEVQR